MNLIARPARPLVLSFYLIFLSVISWIAFAAMFGLFRQPLLPGLVAASILVFDFFMAELLIVLLVCIWLINRGPLFRVMAYILSFTYMAIIAIQLSSEYKGQEFLSRLSLENTNHIAILLDGPTITGICSFLLIFAILPVMTEMRFVDRAKNTELAAYSSACLVVIVLIGFDRFWLPKDIQVRRDDYLGKNQLDHTSPSLALYKTVFVRPRIVELDELNIDAAKKYGFSFNLSAEYPLLKKNIYTGNLPFKKLAGSVSRPNVIVFFTEGFSARMINAYGGRHPGLTPNIDEFIKQSMSVENYYNHTAATYRGLHGQLCSLYPYYGGVGGWNDKAADLAGREYFCLSNLLKQDGYEAVFFDAHREGLAAIKDMMKGLRFDKVFLAEELSKNYLYNEEPIVRRGLSDHQFIDSFIGYLDENTEKLKMDKPFFIGLYNLETHAFVDVAPDGEQYGKGKNASLNTIHNYDHAFGHFWEYFKNSPYVDNTIVILTADHSHYPEPPYVEVAGDNFQRIFVDRIPLIIYDKTRLLPEKFDAKFSTSIDFAPTMAHYLGLSNRNNPFMGTSLFQEGRKPLSVGVVAMGSEIYFVDQSRIYHRHNIAEDFRPEFASMQDFINAVYQLDLKGKVWDKRLN